jgi:hypothetical protein
MTAAHRWWTVGIVVALLVASPVLVRARPAADEDVSAAALLARVRDSRAVPFAGFAETSGAVALPENEALSSLGSLLGETNRVRVWWRDPATWRVASLRTTGETDLVHTRQQTIRWVYESKRATLIPDVPVRLPNAADLVPNELVRHAFAGVEASELRRLPARRVAGRDALGLRLTPREPVAGVGRMDVYVDSASGVPLSAELFAVGSRSAALTSRFLDFSLDPPSKDDLSFTPPPDAERRYDDVVDLAAAADRFAARRPPTTLAGLPDRNPRGSTIRGSVGVYGRGPTVLLAIPLWSRTADRVREDLAKQPGVLSTDTGLLVEAAPLRLLLAEPEPNGTSWLLAGTVTSQALDDAAGELAENRPELSARP